MCCTKTDIRPLCSNTLRNCSSDTGFNTTKNFAYLICGFNTSACGINPDPDLAKDKELDYGFSANSNFILTRKTAINIQSSDGFNTNSRCTYIIKQSKYNLGVNLKIGDNFNTIFTYFIGNRTFKSLTKSATVVQTLLANMEYNVTLADYEYMYIQLTSRSVGALIKFSVTGTGVSEVPPDPVPPGPPGSPPATPPGTPPDTITTTKKKSNLALIIGIAVGVIGFIAIIGFLVYYIMRQKRLMSERLAEEEEEEDEDEDAVQSFK